MQPASLRSEIPCVEILGRVLLTPAHLLISHLVFRQPDNSAQLFDHSYIL